MPRLSWRKDKRYPFMVGREPGYSLFYGERKVGYAGPHYTGFDKIVRGYHWYCRDEDLGIEFHNSATAGEEPLLTIKEAKAKALAYAKDGMRRLDRDRDSSPPIPGQG